MIAVDLQTRKLILYDCLDRAKDTFFMHAKNIKRYLDSQMSSDCNNGVLNESAMGRNRKRGSSVGTQRSGATVGNNRGCNEVGKWKFEAGICTKISS